jgi:hypothetical protein
MTKWIQRLIIIFLLFAIYVGSSVNFRGDLWWERIVSIFSV